MESSEIYNVVVQVLGPYAKNQKGLGKVSEKSRLIEDLGINSARMIDIVADLEKKLKIRIDDETADGMDTVGNAVRILSAKLHG